MDLILFFLFVPAIMYLGIALQIKKQKQNSLKESREIKEKYNGNNIFVLEPRKKQSKEEIKIEEEQEYKKAA